MYLALQRISLLRLLDLDVICHHRVVMELCAIFQVASEGLGLFGMAQVNHVLIKSVLSLALLGALLVLNLKGATINKSLRKVVETCVSGECLLSLIKTTYIAVHLSHLERVQSLGVTHVDPHRFFLVPHVGLFVFNLKHMSISLNFIW